MSINPDNYEPSAQSGRWYRRNPAAGDGLHFLGLTRKAILAVPIVAAALAMLAAGTASASTPATLHYAANGSASAAAEGLGYNLVDTSSPSVAKALPAGVRAMAYVGSAAGATATFKAEINSYLPVRNKVWGFFMIDGRGQTVGAKNLAGLLAEDNYIHSVDPSWRTFIREGNNASSQHPNFTGSATYWNTHGDFFGIDAYPCRVGDTYPTAFTGCNLNYINVTVAALKTQTGIPSWRIVPVFQAFGNYPGGDDSGGNWALPTAAQEQSILARWHSLLTGTRLDYTYSWDTQHGDKALSNSPALQQVFKQHNAAG